MASSPLIMVDKAVAARKIAVVRDAVQRIRNVLPPDDGLETDRTVREVVVLNLFVALQECLAVATHWIAEAGWAVPDAGSRGSGLRAGGEGRLASDRCTLPESQNPRPQRPATSEEYDLVQEQDQEPGLLSGERVRRRPIPPDWATCLLRGEPDPDGSLVIHQ